MKKKLISLVLEAFQDPCRSLESFNEEKSQGEGPMGALNIMTTALIRADYFARLATFRKILTDAELSPEELAEVEQVLGKIEETFKNKEVLESVWIIRHTRQKEQMQNTEDGSLLCRA